LPPVDERDTAGQRLDHHRTGALVAEAAGKPDIDDAA
jgi:hypothetical protein